MTSTVSRDARLRFLMLGVVDSFLFEDDARLPCAFSFSSSFNVLMRWKEHVDVHFCAKTDSWLEALVRGGELDYRAHFRLPKSTVEVITSALFPPVRVARKGRPLKPRSVWVHILLKRLGSRTTVTDLARMFQTSRGVIVTATRVVSDKLIRCFASEIR